MWARRFSMDQVSPERDDSTEDAPGAQRLNPRVASAPTIGQQKRDETPQEEESSSRSDSRYRSYDSLLTSGSRGSTSGSLSWSESPRQIPYRRSERSVRFQTERRAGKIQRPRSRRELYQLRTASKQLFRVGSKRTAPISYESIASRCSYDYDDEDSSDESGGEGELETYRTELELGFEEDLESSSSRGAEYTSSARSDSVAAGRTSAATIEVSSVQNIYQEQARIKMEKGFIMERDVGERERIPRSRFQMHQQPVRGKREPLLQQAEPTRKRYRQTRRERSSRISLRRTYPDVNPGTSRDLEEVAAIRAEQERKMYGAIPKRRSRPQASPSRPSTSCGATSGLPPSRKDYAPVAPSFHRERPRTGPPRQTTISSMFGASSQPPIHTELPIQLVHRERPLTAPVGLPILSLASDVDDSPPSDTNYRTFLVEKPQLEVCKESCLEERIAPSPHSLRLSPPTQDNLKSKVVERPHVPPLELRLMDREPTVVRRRHSSASRINFGASEMRSQALRFSSVTRLEHRQETGFSHEGYNRNLFFSDIIKTRPAGIFILIKKNHKVVTVFVIIPNLIKSGFLSAYILDGKIMKPLGSLYSTSPNTTRHLSGLVAELKLFLPTEEVTLLSEWSVIDPEMMTASFDIISKNPEIAPDTLYTLISEKLFSDVKSMSLFFAQHYAAYREQQISLIKHEMRKEPVQPVEVEDLERRIAGISVKGPVSEEDVEYREKQRRYAQSLKPPFRIPPLPSRPRSQPPAKRKEEPKMYVSRPPTAAELADVQACYDRDGRPKVKSRPRRSQSPEKDEK